MKPTDRRRMVDSTIGLTVIDDLVKWAGDEGRTVLAQAEGLAQGLVKPQATAVPIRRSSNLLPCRPDFSRR